MRAMGRRALVLALLVALLAGWLPAAGVARAATLTVTTTANSGAGSLRQAIADAAAGDTIIFDLAPAPQPWTVELTSGEMAIAKDLTIAGPGASLLTVRRSAAGDPPDFRIFNVTGGTIELAGLTIAGGRAGDGAGLNASGAGTVLRLTGVVVTGNVAQHAGGLYLAAGARAILTGSSVTGNSATVQSGGIEARGGGTALDVIGSTVGGNAAAGGIVGGLLVAEGAHARVADASAISGNTARQSAGIEAQGSGTRLDIAGSTLAGNTATVEDGGGLLAITGATVTVTNSVVSENSAAQFGGGIRAASGATVTVTGTTVRANTAGFGGGIGGQGAATSVTLVDSTVGGNTATTGNGGGLYARTGASLGVSGSTISGNTTPAQGGGVYINAAGATIANTTVSGNDATTNGGGLIVVFGGSATLTNTTIADNSGPGGSQLRRGDSGGTLVARNTIVTGPDPAGLCYGPITDGGANLDRSTSCGFAPATGGLSGVDPRLGPLAENGGPTRTHALLPGSPAIDAGDPAACAASGPGQPNGRDQRGVSRPRGPRCDIGAFEMVRNAPVAADDAYGTPYQTALTVAAPGILANDADADGDPLTAVRTTGPQHGTLALAPDGAFTYTPAAGYSGPDSFTYRPHDGLQDGNVATVAITVGAAPQSTVTASVQGSGGAISPSGATAFPTGGRAVYTATANAGQLFLGWTLDGQRAGYASPLTFTVNGDRTLVARFAPRPAFSDVAPSGVQWEAITQLAARGIINGYGDGTFGPTDPVQRAQIAALIVRALGWDGGAPGGPAPFSDLDLVDPELARAIVILTQRGIARGYPDGTFNPTGEVTHAQAISLIAPSMVQAGYWQAVAAAEDDGTVYPNIPASSPHRLDLLTFVKYAGAIPDRPANQAWADWEGPSSRGWTARVLWLAYASHFGADNVP